MFVYFCLFMPNAEPSLKKWIIALVSSTPPPAPVQGSNGSMLGGLRAVVGQGLAFGTGSAVAHRAVDAMMGPRVAQHENVPSSASEGASAPNTSSPEAAQACGG